MNIDRVWDWIRDNTDMYLHTVTIPLEELKKILDYTEGLQRQVMVMVDQDADAVIHRLEQERDEAQQLASERERLLKVSVDAAADVYRERDFLRAQLQAKEQEIETQREALKAFRLTLDVQNEALHKHQLSEAHSDALRQVAEARVAKLEEAIEIERECHFVDDHKAELYEMPAGTVCACGGPWPCVYEKALRAALAPPSDPSTGEAKRQYVCPSESHSMSQCGSVRVVPAPAPTTEEPAADVCPSCKRSDGHKRHERNCGERFREARGERKPEPPAEEPTDPFGHCVLLEHGMPHTKLEDCLGWRAGKPEPPSAKKPGINEVYIKPEGVALDAAFPVQGPSAERIRDHEYKPGSQDRCVYEYASDLTFSGWRYCGQPAAAHAERKEGA